MPQIKNVKTAKHTITKNARVKVTKKNFQYEDYTGVVVDFGGEQNAKAVYWIKLDPKPGSKSEPVGDTPFMFLETEIAAL